MEIKTTTKQASKQSGDKKRRSVLTEKIKTNWMEKREKHRSAALLPTRTLQQNKKKGRIQWSNRKWKKNKLENSKSGFSLESKERKRKKIKKQKKKKTKTINFKMTLFEWNEQLLSEG